MKSIYAIRRKFVLLQAIVFLIALFYEYSIQEAHNYSLILFYSLWNGISYLWLFYNELKFAPDFHPYQILALISAQFIGFNGVNCYLELIEGNNLYFGSALINDAMFLGIIYLSLQHLLLFGVFYFLEHKNRKRNHTSLKLGDKIRQSKIEYFDWGIRFYLFVWSMRIISLIIPLASISSILVSITNIGHIVTLFLLTFAMIQYPMRSRAKYCHWIIVVLEIILVMNHGMKEEIIRTLVPYCIYILISYKAGFLSFRISTILNMSFIAVFIVFFVFPYVSIFRNISITTGRSWNDISTSEALSEYSKYINKEGIYAYDEEERGAGYLMSRAGAIDCNAFSIDYAKKHGTSPEFLAYCGMALIPRIIWPSKPSVVLGGMAYALATGDENWAQAKSSESYGNSVSLGYIGSCYFSLGFLGSIFLILFHSFFIWYLWNFLKQKMLYNLVALWAFSGFVFLLLKDFESFSDCGFNFVVFNIIYILLCKFVYKGPKKLVD